MIRLQTFWSQLRLRGRLSEPVFITGFVRVLTIPAVWASLPTIRSSTRAMIHQAIPDLDDALLDAWLNDRDHLVANLAQLWLWAHFEGQLQSAFKGYRRAGPGLLFFDGRPSTDHHGGYLSYGDGQNQFGSYPLSLARDLRVYDPERMFAAFLFWSQPGIPGCQRSYWMFDRHNRHVSSISALQA